MRVWKTRGGGLCICLKVALLAPSLIDRIGGIITGVIVEYT